MSLSLSLSFDLTFHLIITILWIRKLSSYLSAILLFVQFTHPLCVSLISCTEKLSIKSSTMTQDALNLYLTTSPASPDNYYYYCTVVVSSVVDPGCGTSSVVVVVVASSVAAIDCKTLAVLWECHANRCWD